MTLLYPNLCKNEVCYKGTALYVVLFHMVHTIQTVISIMWAVISHYIIGPVKQNFWA